MDQIEELLAQNPGASGPIALRELHYGRIAWLAEHIRRCDFQISPTVAKKILSLIERDDESCLFELSLSRRADAPAAAKDPTRKLHRAADMAIDVARLGGFVHGHMERACRAIAPRYYLSWERISREIKPFREMALQVVEEEMSQALYDDGKIDILGRPICSD